ncbi:MAG: cell division protein ZapE [Blastochloris viridis]|uniref:Cell division protein ZapE n=1 Tax=Blastochloris viridis TaxID=1079 RepID=A0A6N4RCQ5_BLAVI|nr:MAG: cell division protein ZapE [Blastochloris viridis]
MSVLLKHYDNYGPLGRFGSMKKVDLFAVYQQRLNEGWQPDAAQARAVMRLQTLAKALQSDMDTPPRGLWLYGPPGRGKSQMLDMFMDALPFPNKRRVHFHAFMAELHRRLNAMPPAEATLPGRRKPDLVERLAAEIAAEASVLGFDEFYLTNLPDAMFLGRLMQALFKQGTVVVATSNWNLPDLFQGGLNRDRFTPLLKLLEQHMEPINLTDGLDYRLRETKDQASTYIMTKRGESAEAQLQVLFEEYAQGEAGKPLPFLHAKRQAGSVVWATFSELCDQPLGRLEYQQLADRFQTVIIEGIPQLTSTEADSALRLATLVDILYERGHPLIVSAAVPPSQICRAGAAAQVFERTTSRLVQMTHSQGDFHQEACQSSGLPASI